MLDIQTWHPLTVHFPIAFLMLSGFLSLYLLIRYSRSMAKFNLGLMGLGILSAFLSLYTGDIEDGKVSRTLCDPTVLKTHENYAYYMIWCYVTLFIFWFAKLYSVIRHYKVIMTLFIVISSIAGLGTLIYTGHLGASLVYEQAAGVQVPDEDCSDFN
jgi:uncharacterized membrane protein